MKAKQSKTSAKSKVDESPNRLIGYARVSTADQQLDLQIDALRNAGCGAEHIFVDKVSGVKTDRPGLANCMAAMQRGDTLVVWRLDRLGRLVRHLVTLIDELQSRGIGFRSISDGAIDTTTASGKLIFNVFSALSEFERSLIQERTKAGLIAARARGRFGGRPKLDPNDPRVATAKTLHRDKSLSISDITSTLRISKATLYRWLAVANNVSNQPIENAPPNK